MGTGFRIQAACDGALPVAAVDAALARVDAVFSTYRDDSELSRLNARSTSPEPQPVSAELARVLSVAAAIARASGGALDPTVGPLVDRWGFGPAGVSAPPTPAAIADGLRGVGMAAVQIRRAPAPAAADAPAATGEHHLVAFTAPRRLDLSALAKGRGVDLVAEALQVGGCAHFLVDIGGEIRVRGRSPRGAPWRLGIEQPGALAPGYRPLPALVLTEGAVATSGDYRNYREVDGVRRSHLIDPRTGYPIAHALAAVTVWHPQTMHADAWATALNVLAPAEARETAEREGLVAAFLLRRSDGLFEPWRSSAFAERFESTDGDRVPGETL